MPRMRRQFPFVLVFALLSAACLSAQEPKAQLPTAFGQWSFGSGLPSKVTLHFEPNDPKAAVFLEAGVAELASANYNLGAKTTKALVYAFRDSSGAYEAFTYLRSPDMTTLDSSLGHSAAFNVDRALLSAGNLLVELAPAAEISTDDLQDLLLRIATTADKTPFPPIQTFLPKEGRVAGSERYALGPVAFRSATGSEGRGEFAPLADQTGFSSGAEAMFAKYKTGRNEAMLLLIDYPTPQLAEMHLRHFERALSGTKQSGSSVERKGSLLSIVLAPTSAEYAEKLRGAVNYETQVTWNEPSTTATDPPITSTLVKIIIATGVFMMMAIVLGIAFGGVRVITKRLFPGKVFDRPAQMEVLQLGLSSKPIDPRDMY
jgi:hypothetical protein